MKSTKQALCAALGVALVILSLGAAQARQPDNGAGFAIRPILPENQIDRSVGYYYLAAKPGQAQTLEMVILNRGDEDIRVMLEANTAFSNANGLIEYTFQAEKNPSLTVDFAAQVTIDAPILLVPAHGEAVAEFAIQMPEEAFEGEILGGVLVKKLPPEKPEAELETSEQQPSDGLAITNVFVYTIAVRIRENDEIVEPAFEVQNARMGKMAGYPALAIDIRNPRPLIVKNLTLYVRIFADGNDEAVISFVKENRDMAPNSLMPLHHVLIAENPLPPGLYRVEAKLLYEETVWAFDLPMVVEAE